MKKRVVLLLGIVCAMLGLAAAGYVEAGKKQTAANMSERIEQAAKGNAPTLIISDADVSPGERVVLPVTIVNNPGILGMSLTLFYDEDVMELIRADNGDAVKGVLNMSKSKELGSGCIFLWDGEDITSEQICDGEVLLLEFKILKSASVGRSSIVLTSDEDGIFGRDLQIVPIAVEDGVVTVQE